MIQLPPDDADRAAKLLHGRAAEPEPLSTMSRTQLEASHAALAESERRLRAILGSATGDAILTLDSQGQVTSWNAEAERILGWTEADILGRDAAVLYTPIDREAGEPAAEMRVAAAKGQASSERWALRRDGTRFWAAQTLAPLLGTDGVDRGFLKILRARAGQRQAGTALARGGALQPAEELLDQSQRLETVGRLASGIAHDFNNLLQGIGGNLDMVQLRLEQGRAVETGRYVEIAHKGVDRAAALTARLLAYVRWQPAQPCPVNPAALALGLAELIGRTVGPATAVELHLHDAGPVLCDPSQFDNALLNLAVNARDAMPEGGRLSISTRHVGLSGADVAGQDGAAAGDYVETAVADTGAGMAPEVLAHAFEPFFTTKAAGHGTGLGLSQLHSFVRQWGGTVHLESAPGQGTTIRFCLPRHKAGPMIAVPGIDGCGSSQSR